MSGKRSRPNVPDQVWFTATIFRRWFGLQVNNLQQRSVTTKSGPNGSTLYDADEVITKCGDLIHKRFSEKYRTSGGVDIETIKAEVEQEKLRKLRIENDEREGNLVSALDVEQTYTRSMRAVCDVLDSLPSRVKMANPDVSQAVLDTVNTCLIEVRNKAAALDLEIEDEGN